MDRPIKYPYKKARTYDGVQLSGIALQTLASSPIMRPSVGQIRGLLLDLRARFELPQITMAAILGVPVITLRRWEDGTRIPSDAAQKLIWLMHRLFTAPHTVKNVIDIVTWGTFEGGLGSRDNNSTQGTPTNEPQQQSTGCPVK